MTCSLVYFPPDLAATPGEDCHQLAARVTALTPPRMHSSPRSYVLLYTSNCQIETADPPAAVFESVSSLRRARRTRSRYQSISARVEAVEKRHSGGRDVVIHSEIENE